MERRIGVEPWIRVAVLSVGGALGVNARYWLGAWITGRTNPQFPWATFIINVSGDCSFGSAQVVLAGGLKASQVLWNFPGTGTAVNVYKDITYVSGTFLVPFRDYVQDVAHLNGVVIGGGNVRIHSGATVTYPETCTP